MKSSAITVTDMFCGAGGSTTGAVQAGAEVRLAMNHWARAIETHHTNYPETDHAQADISQTDPRRYPATTMLIASPECTNHSLAKGRTRKGQGQLALWDQSLPDPAEERSRCTMWDPLRWAETHQYRAIVLENVVDARYWRLWDAWLHAWQALDYAWELVYLNSMFVHPTPQSRDRLYFVAWKRKDRKPDLKITPLAFCVQCGQDCQAVQCWKNPARPHGKYGRSGQYVYRCPLCTSETTPYYYAAANAIDWSWPIQRIGDRQRPLKEKTLHRIAYGLAKFTHESLPKPVPAQVMVSPFLVHLSHSDDPSRVFPAQMRPFPTQTARDDLGLALPFVLNQLWEYRVHPVTEPLSTMVAEGNHHGLVLPPAWLMSYYKNGSIAPIVKPVSTITTLERHALVLGEGTNDIDACGFRMLEPHEIQAAMAFPCTYKVTGTRREQVKQLGNAVTPPVMQLLVSRCIAALES
jgi:DNA (cytosine-5)-methyltransferase 1